MSLSSIATRGFLTGSLGLVATRGFLDTRSIEPVEPPVTVIVGGGGGRGSGPTNGIRKEGGYRPNYQDVLDDIRMEKIKREDIEIIEFIKVILTKGLL